MKQQLEVASRQLLAPGGIDRSDLEKTLERMMVQRIDYADLYFEFSQAESWVLEEGIIREGAHSIDQGVGARAVSEDKTGFAYSDEIILPALADAAGFAGAIAGSGGNRKLPARRRGQELAPLYPDLNPLTSLDVAQKLELLRRIDADARGKDPRVTQVIASLGGSYRAVLVAGSDGAYAADLRPLVRLNVKVIVEQQGRRETGNAGGGGRCGYDCFLEEGRVSGYVDSAVAQALEALDADAAPAGAMTVVLGPGWPGILLHEAVGHGLEGDFNRKGVSAFSGRIGEQVASASVTVVDDGAMKGRRGSLTVDDEGTPTETTVLIEKGVLKNYMQDKMNARLMGMKPTGNGRRESYAYLPMPRMTNTYMLNGECDPEEIIGSVEKGVYAAQFGGGQVDITNGKFVFSASQARLIEKGRLTRTLKGVTLIGDGPTALGRISMVGNDLQLDPGIGVCGKDGQSVPVGVGQPTLRIDEMTVGGTAG